MSSHHWPPDPELVGHLELKIYPLSDRSRWAWQLIDDRNGTVFETELQYASAVEARQAGLTRLAELTPSLPGAKLGTRSAPPGTGHLIIVVRHELVLYDFLKRIFAESEGIDVIRDRRRSPPASYPTPTDRRAARVTPEAQGQGWWMVRRSEAKPRFGFRETLA